MMPARDPAIVGECKVGFFRVGVKTPRWEQLIQRLGRVGSERVTRRRKTLLDRDLETGWFNYEWSDDTVDGVLLERGSRMRGLPAGVVVNLDAALWCLNGFEPGWQVYDPVTQKYYEVKTVVEYRDHEKGGFAYRVCQLSYLDLYVE